MNLRPLLASIPLLVVACKKSDDAPAPPAPATARPAPAATRTRAPAPRAYVAAQVALADGEKLGGGQTGGKPTLRWKIPGGTVTLAAVENMDGVMLRGFTEDRTFDITPRMPRGDIEARLEPIAGGKAVVMTLTTLVERDPEGGTLKMYDVARIEWDAAAGTPVVRQTWTCDESEGKSCTFPAWSKG